MYFSYICTAKQSISNTWIEQITLNTSTDSEDNPYLNQGCNSQFKNTENDALDVQNINDIVEESTEYLREAFGVSTSWALLSILSRKSLTLSLPRHNKFKVITNKEKQLFCLRRPDRFFLPGRWRDSWIHFCKLAIPLFVCFACGDQGWWPYLTS